MRGPSVDGPSFYGIDEKEDYEMRRFRIKRDEHRFWYIGFMKKNSDSWYRSGFGIMLYPSGKIYKIGVFQRKGLRYGIDFYDNGHVRTVAIYNDGEKISYYGPSYPEYGIYYDEAGKLLYEGKFVCGSKGSLGWPVIIKPEGYYNRPH